MLLEKFREIQSFLRGENQGFDELISKVSKLVECNAYLINSDGDIQSCATPNGPDCTASGELQAVKPEFKQRISFIFQTAANLPVESCLFRDNKCFQPNTFMTIIPIRSYPINASYLLLTKANKQFNDDELLLAETASLVLSIYFYENDNVDNDTVDRQKATAQLVLDSLSFSELKAISNVFKDLNGLEGFLVASKIADRIGISRSVIVNAMRKLESAGVVDSRSLGIKGTYIKIKNKNFLEALKARVKYS
ncbi:MAG: GTP-sensing pleiotropic transcriptional regulator CodY [Firmicutes bacterium]|nr:GTP-sensing pleiotropic transcriptional regulator CodY [Bacillota bacterium]